MTACSATAAARRVAGSVRSCTRPVRHHPALPTWLSSSEQRRAAAIRNTAARNAWLSARHVAKRLVAAGLPGWPADPPEQRLAALEGSAKWSHDLYEGPAAGGSRAGRFNPRNPTTLGTKL
jgi:hypothetical protein